MLAEERLSAPATQPSRRNLFAAAAVVAVIPLASPALAAAKPGGPLADILARRNALADAINHGDLLERLSDEEAHPTLDRCWAMDNVIHDAPIGCVSDAVAKLSHMIQLDSEDFDIASPRTIATMKQVVAYLEAAR